MKFYLLTLGCPKNEVDSEGMSHLLEAAGHQQVDEPTAADVMIVNTCGFIDRSKDESFEHLRKLAALKRRTARLRRARGQGRLLIAAGCLGERYAEQLARQVPDIDGVLGTQRWGEIVQLLSDAGRGIRPCWTGSQRVEAATERHVQPGRVSSYLKVADGCDSQCAFCAIPRLKGPQHSRPVAAILAEARALAQQGVKEIVLISQDTTSYGHDRGEDEGLAHLLELLTENVADVPWLRIMYAHPANVTERLLKVMAERPQVLRYLDLPLQHGHPAVLRRMLRPVNGRQVVARVREAMPDAAIRSAFIVGFPGETEEEFRGLLEFLEQMRFDRVGVFQYSREEGTPAAGLGPQIPDRLKRRRYERAMELQQSISLSCNQAMVGRELEVLVEGKSDDLAFAAIGRSYRDAPEVDGLVLVKQPLQVGTLARVRVVEALEYDLVGEVMV